MSRTRVLLPAAVLVTVMAGTVLMRPRANPAPGPRDAEKATPSDLDTGRDTSCFRLRVILPKNTYRNDEAVRFSLDFENHGAGPVVVWSSGIFPNHRIELRDHLGNDVPLTEFGKQCREAFAWGRKARDKNFPVRTAPGNVHRVIDEFDLRKFFEIPAGRFELTVVYDEFQGPDPLTIASKPARFEVAAREPDKQ